MVLQAWDTRWKVWNGIGRWLVYPRVRLLFAVNGIAWGHDWRFHGVPIIQKHRQSRMSFGPGLGLRSFMRSNPLAPNHPVVLATWREGALLETGANFAMTGGTLCAARRITIGHNVTVGANTTIIDTDFHSLDTRQRWSERSGGETAAVAIGDNVFIGMNCIVLKGVTIGEGAAIGAGSVVTADVPPHVVVAGNPATFVRELAGEPAGRVSFGFKPITKNY